jgi:carbon-monoxide dehydrogenase medium subunit
VKPAPFEYLAARTQDDALVLKAEHGGDARFLAGGQSLVPVLNFRLAQPRVLIDINDVAGASGVALAGDTVRIGALTRYRDLQREALIARHCPLIAEALPHIAHPQIRNRGTIGGNLCHADPASELPAIMLALGARLRLCAVGGERTLASQDFFNGALSTALKDDEMLVEIILPVTKPRTGTSFLEVARRRGDFAMMGIAASITVDERGTCQAARLAYCGAGDGPVLGSRASAALIGCTLNEQDIEEAARLAMQEVDPSGSVHASAEYQRHLSGVLTKRALKIAKERSR